MPNKRNRASRLFDRAVNSLESATATAGSKVKESLDTAAEAVADSDPARRIIGKAAAARTKVAKKVAKKQATATAKKAGGAKKP